MSKTPTPRKGSASAAKPPRKAACAPAPVAYCGPTIPGKAVQFTTYTHGLSSPLLEAVQAESPGGPTGPAPGGAAAAPGQSRAVLHPVLQSAGDSLREEM